jgi:hypothetical protein
MEGHMLRLAVVCFFVLFLQVALAQESTPKPQGADKLQPADKIKSGDYEKPSLGTKLKLSLWAVVNSERLKNVKVLYAYDMLNICKSKHRVDQPAAIVAANRGDDRTIRITDDIIVVQNFVCADPGLSDAPRGLYLLTAAKLPIPYETEFVALESGDALKPDFVSLELNQNRIIADQKTYPAQDFLGGLKGEAPDK